MFFFWKKFSGIWYSQHWVVDSPELISTSSYNQILNKLYSYYVYNKIYIGENGLHGS